MRLTVAVFLALFLLSTLAHADQLQDGKAAYDLKDYQTALKLWRPLAAQGNAEAQVKIGNLYDWARGVPQDYAEALKWYRKAADQGNAEAQYDIGRLYKYGGPGVKKDDEESVKWLLAGAESLRKEAERGDANAQFTLATKYMWGEGVKHDDVETAKWLRKAAEQGNVGAETSLGRLYLYGSGVKQNYTEAVKWLARSADQGESIAEDILGGLYEGGSCGVQQNLVEAYMWYSLAVKNGEDSDFIYGESGIKRLMQEMTAKQIAEAKQRISAWQKDHPAPASKP